MNTLDDDWATAQAWKAATNYGAVGNEWLRLKELIAACIRHTIDEIRLTNQWSE